MQDQIHLAIPATSQMLLVARMALTGFCCQYGADMDTLDDVRTLSDEACFCLMHQHKQAEALHIHAKMRGLCAHIRFAVSHGEGTAQQGLHDPEIARGILGTLCSSVSLLTDQGVMHAIEVEVNLDSQ